MEAKQCLKNRNGSNFWMIELVWSWTCYIFSLIIIWLRLKQRINQMNNLKVSLVQLSLFVKDGHNDFRCCKWLMSREVLFSLLLLLHISSRIPYYWMHQDSRILFIFCYFILTGLIALLSWRSKLNNDIWMCLHEQYIFILD
jgi:hypothetical protein